MEGKKMTMSEAVRDIAEKIYRNDYKEHEKALRKQSVVISVNFNPSYFDMGQKEEQENE